jgi:hypothetical protein
MSSSLPGGTPTPQPSPGEIEKAELQQLSEFLLSRQLVRLETRLGGFNLFNVLGLANKELIHSRMLAWLLQPGESHGLGDLFLRRWLMHVLSDADVSDAKLPTAPDIEAAEWVEVDAVTEVAMSREDRLDVVVTLRERGQVERLWLVAVEVKVDSDEGDQQLPRYSQVLAKRYPNADQKVLLFLTKYETPPSDPLWIHTQFEVVATALRDSIAQRADGIGAGPKLVLSNYVSLLEETFMTNSKVIRAVENIVKMHPEAVELLVKHRPDRLLNWTRLLRNELKNRQAAMEISVKDSDGRDYIIFAPKAWGTASSFKKAPVLAVVEIDDSGVGLRIHATGHSSLELKDKLTTLAKNEPGVFKRGTPKGDKVSEPTLESDWWLDQPLSDDPANAKIVVDQLANELKGTRLTTVVAKIAHELTPPMVQQSV